MPTATTSIRGTKAAHAWVNDAKRATKGDDAPKVQALQRLGDEYDSLLKGNPVGSDSKFHFILVIERNANAL